MKNIDSEEVTFVKHFVWKLLSLLHVFLRSPKPGFSSPALAVITVTQTKQFVSHSCFVTALSLQLLFIDLTGHRNRS
jgi:hypothetical protein